MKISFGERRTSPGPPPDTEDAIHGQGWKAVRNDDRYLLDFDNGEVVARDRTIEISAAEFDKLRQDKTQFLAIVYAHGG